MILHWGRCWRGQSGHQLLSVVIALASDLNTVIDNVLRNFRAVLSWLSFRLLYSIVPTTRVPNRDAVIGAFVAAVLFEAGKKGFALHITMFPSYQLIYGVLR
ncbi:YihY family inner membrane protein [Shigella flexneri]